MGWPSGRSCCSCKPPRRAGRSHRRQPRWSTQRWRWRHLRWSSAKNPALSQKSGRKTVRSTLANTTLAGLPICVGWTNPPFYLLRGHAPGTFTREGVGNTTPRCEFSTPMVVGSNNLGVNLPQRHSLSKATSRKCTANRCVVGNGGHASRRRPIPPQGGQASRDLAVGAQVHEPRNRAVSDPIHWMVVRRQGFEPRTR